MIRRPRSKNTAADYFDQLAETEGSARLRECQGRSCSECFAFVEHALWPCGVGVGGVNSRRERPRAARNSLISHDACRRAVLLLSRLADVAVTCKQSIRERQERCASEGKSVQRRGGFTPWHGRLSRKPKRAHVGQARLPLLACCNCHRSSRGRRAVPG